MNTKVVKSSAAVLACAMLLAGCSAADQRRAGGTAIGALTGAVIGGAVGGQRGIAIGALAGGLAGFVIADAIERQRAQEAALYSARTGSGTTRSFRNSSGQSVVVRTRVVRSYQDNGQRVRVIRRDFTRNGQAAGSDTLEGREVKLANGQTQWTGIE